MRLSTRVCIFSVDAVGAIIRPSDYAGMIGSGWLFRYGCGLVAAVVLLLGKVF